MLVLLCITLNVVGVYIPAAALAGGPGARQGDAVGHCGRPRAPSLDVPVRSTVASAALVTALGCIYVGSDGLQRLRGLLHPHVEQPRSWPPSCRTC